MEPSRSPLTGLRVLVVEDEYMVADHIAMLLEDLGCEVAGSAATVEQALELMQSKQIDGVLLDGNLNGETSAPVAVELRSRSIPFVVATGYGQLELGAEALNGAPRLAKPFSNSQFERILIEAFLPKPSDSA